MDRLDPSSLPDGTYLTWQGRRYRGSRGAGTVTLLSPAQEEGFEPRLLGGGFQRTVPESDVEIVTLRTRCWWRGAPFVVMTAVGDELVLRYTGGDHRQAEELGLTERERGIYQTTVPASEVTGLHQVRTTD